MKLPIKIKIAAFCILLTVSLTSCHIKYNKRTSGRTETETNLRQFACANCFYWYFRKKGYDTKDIRAISGGIVELGYYSADKYQKISMLIKNYKPDIKTKNEIDIDLLKCFLLDESAELNELIDSLK